MSTPQRAIYPGEIYHVYNRAVERKTIFHGPDDYDRFLMRARTYKQLFPAELLAYCIMPNHFHFLIREPMPSQQSTPGVDGNPRGLTISFLHRLQTAYSKYYGIKYADTHSGHLFQGRYRIKHVDDDGYLQTLIAYIHDNPVRAKLVQHPAEWPYSSYLDLTKTKSDNLTTHDDMLSDLNHQQIWEIFARDRNTSCTALTPTIFNPWG